MRGRVLGRWYFIGTDAFYKATATIKKFDTPDTIKLIDVKTDHNRRQGISLISGRKVDIIRPILMNTRGFGDPEAGIDVEPDKDSHVIEELYIEDAITKNNAGAGIQFYLRHLENSNTPVSIEINGHEDYGSLYGVLVQGKKGRL